MSFWDHLQILKLHSSFFIFHIFTVGYILFFFFFLYCPVHLSFWGSVMCVFMLILINSKRNSSLDELSISSCICLVWSCIKISRHFKENNRELSCQMVLLFSSTQITNKDILKIFSYLIHRALESDRFMSADIETMTKLLQEGKVRSITNKEALNIFSKGFGISSFIAYMVSNWIRITCNISYTMVIVEYSQEQNFVKWCS